MEHPTYEQLLMLVEKTNSQGSAKAVREHVARCPKCATEIAGWQRTIERLEDYRWPAAKTTTPAFLISGLKWAAAAALIMAIGFGLGRLSQPSGERLNQLIAQQVKQQVPGAVRTDLLTALAESDSQTPNAFSQQLHRALAAAVDHGLPAAERQRLVQETLQAVQWKQDENQRIIFAALKQIQQQDEANYLSIRRDLETAASVAESDLQRNQEQLSQLEATLAQNP
jgi:anti-sigma factor RsiW